jgi:hypothetical protein
MPDVTTYNRTDNLHLSVFLPLEGGGQEEDGVHWRWETPSPNPPLEGDGWKMAEDHL